MLVKYDGKKKDSQFLYSIKQLKGSLELYIHIQLIQKPLSLQVLNSNP